MKTSNPALGSQFNRFTGQAVAAGEAMTVDGTVHKTGLMALLVTVTAAVGWTMAETPMGALLGIGGAIAGLILGLATAFKPTWAPWSAPLYALAEGLFLGFISYQVGLAYGFDLPIYALGLTIGTLLAMLMLYQTGVIKVTEKFRMGVVAATGGIFLVYMLSFVLGFFGMSVPFIHGSGWIGIGFSLFVVGLAALNLVLDFDLIDRGARHGAPKYMEWYGAFALTVTLVWLYIEILRLLAKLRNR